MALGRLALQTRDLDARKSIYAGIWGDYGGTPTTILTPLPQSFDDLQRERSRLQVALTQMDDLRPGSLVPRFRKCGKPTCHCAKPDSSGHGPSYSLTRELEGKTVTKIIPPSAVEQTQRSDRRVQAVSGLNSRFCRGQ